MASWRVAVWAGLLAAFTVRADVTVHELNDVKLSSAFPAAVADAMRQQMGGSLQHQLTIQAKDGKCRTPAGSIESLLDTGKGTVTLFDSKTKQFATLPVAEYREKTAAKSISAAQAKLLQAAKFDVTQAEKTGESAEMLGVRADQYLIALTLQAGTATTRLEIRIWAASKAELARAPGLREWAGCSAGQDGSSDTIQNLQKIFSQFPGLADKLNAVMASLKDLNSTLTLKTQMAVFSPASALAPAILTSTEVQQVSTDALPEALFAVPADYKQASAEALLAAMQPPPPAAAGSSAGLTPPVPTYSPGPKYTDEARLKKIEGTVIVILEVDEHGAPQNVQVLQPLDPGLDQRAVETVSQWKFKPGEKDGHPVAMRATVRVKFQLPAEGRQ